MLQQKNKQTAKAIELRKQTGMRIWMSKWQKDFCVTGSI